MEWVKPLRRDISSYELRAALKSRSEPYWTMLCINRGIGYYKDKSNKGFWVARAAKPERNRSVEHRLGRADDAHEADGIQYFSFDQAVICAWDWFRTLKTGTVNDVRPPGRIDEMLYSPVGAIFTVAHAAKEYLELKRVACSISWYRAALAVVNTYILPEMGAVAVDDLSVGYIQKFLRHVIETPSLQSRRWAGERDVLEDMDDETLRKRRDRANATLGILRGSLVLAWESGRTENDRCWRSLKFIRNPERPRFLHLTRAECKSLLKECRPDLAQLVQAALYTGCRMGELTRMTVEDIGRDGYGVYVVPGKTRKPRFVFLPDEGMAFFLELTHGKKRRDLLFRRFDGKQWNARLWKTFKKAVRAAGLPDNFTFHGLRHTYASQLIQAGTPLIVIAEQLGHVNSLSVNTVYGHLAPQIREAEIRQRFTSISRKNLISANAQKQNFVGCIGQSRRPIGEPTRSLKTSKASGKRPSRTMCLRRFRSKCDWPV